MLDRGRAEVVVEEGHQGVMRAFESSSKPPWEAAVTVDNAREYFDVGLLATMDRRSRERPE